MDGICLVYLVETPFSSGGLPFQEVKKAAAHHLLPGTPSTDDRALVWVLQNKRIPQGSNKFDIENLILPYFQFF